MAILDDLKFIKNVYKLDEYVPRNSHNLRGDVIRHAMDNPVDSTVLPEFLEKIERIIILVNDASRATPTALVLKEILPLLKIKECRYIIATGTHRNPTEIEIASIFGDFAEQLRDQIFFHDCHNDLDFYGTTSFKNSVYFNKNLTWADAVIVIGSVEPHYFAGYSGGRKSLLPGIAGYETIERNHKLALSKDSEILKLKDNPIHEDMVEALGFIEKPIFSIQMVLDIKNNVYDCVTGNIIQSLEICTKMVDETYKISIDKIYDIVIAIVDAPLDRNLYQAHKGIENCKKILKKGGIFILVANCNEGIGNDNFYNLLAQCKSPEEVFSRIEAQYILGYHKAAKLSQLLMENKIYLVSNLKKKTVENIFFTPYKSLKTALEMSIKQSGKDNSIAIVYNAGVSVAINKA